ncbi:uncharacterized protein LOC115758361 [Drosophila novamexicana]|uniref:uncharacterized protein LOC115758361 n=1 Tax=Drosophila novamexicana TaxID=47314 RepID=UPI0011E5A017|nr:uncharacterized protein LOC115758361 [Drosophila novamexicana]
MFQRKFLEIFVVILYWLIFTPSIYTTFTKKGWLLLDFGALQDTIWAVLIFGLVDVMGFVTFYRIVMFMYKKLKKFDKKSLKKVHQKYKNGKNDLEAQCIEEKYLDVPDGTKKRTIKSRLQARF